MISVTEIYPSNWNVSQKALSTYLLHAEPALEIFLHIWQTKDEMDRSYSFLKGVTSLFVSIPFCTLTAIVALIEGVASLILAGGAYLVACRFDSWKDLPGNLFWRAVLTDCSGKAPSCLMVFGESMLVPLSGVANLVSQAVKRSLFSP